MQPTTQPFHTLRWFGASAEEVAWDAELTPAERDAVAKVGRDWQTAEQIGVPNGILRPLARRFIIRGEGRPVDRMSGEVVVATYEWFYKRRSGR